MHQEEIISSMQGREVIYAFFSDIFLFLADDKHIMLLKEILPALKEICSCQSLYILPASISVSCLVK